MRNTRPLRIRRSELATPGTSDKMVTKAAASDADLVFLDLEDAVAPSMKESARANIVRALNELDWGRTIRAYRINGVETPWCHGDLIDVVSGAGANIDVIIVPKVKAPRHVWFVDDMLTQLERCHGLEEGRIGLELLIEETEALACVEEIAACSPRLEALILGVGDLAASQGIRTGHIGASTSAPADLRYPGDMWHYARNRMIVAARANGLDAIDGPYGDFSNPDGYRREASWGATLGAVGKWCIHPSQIEVANEVFSPTEPEIAEAEKVIAAVKEAEANGMGSANLGGMMIDAATTRLFQTVIDRARHVLAPGKQFTDPASRQEVTMATVRRVPEKYPEVSPYLIVDSAGEALEFYSTVFDATERMRMPGFGGVVGYAELQIGQSVIKVSDERPDMGMRSPKTMGGTPVMISVYVDDVDAVFERATVAGATVLHPVADQFWGDRSGQFEDPFGHRWNVASRIEDVSRDEMVRRAARQLAISAG